MKTPHTTSFVLSALFAAACSGGAADSGTLDGAATSDGGVGDMTDPALGRFDHVVAMDSLIHYDAHDLANAIAQLALRARNGLAFTFAPRTPLLALMHFVGRTFPSGNRAPEIEPIAEDDLRGRIADHPALSAFAVSRTERVACGFYTSQAMELVRQ